MEINGATLEVVRASVVSVQADAIVNAANTKMRGGGGVDGAIHVAAGPALLEELCRIAPRGAQTAEVIVTQGHKLPQRFIFHVAGPIYRNHKPAQARRLLESCYLNCLEEAERRDLESIAFPSISTGAYGYPLHEGAHVALDVAHKYLLGASGSVRRVSFAMFALAEFDVFTHELARLEGEDGEPQMQSWQSQS